MQLDEAARGGVILQNDYAPRIRTYDCIVWKYRVVRPRTAKDYEEYIPFVPPVSLKAAKERIDPNTSSAITVETLPVCVSGRSSSNLDPRETMSS